MYQAPNALPARTAAKSAGPVASGPQGPRRGARATDGIGWLLSASLPVAALTTDETVAGIPRLGSIVPIVAVALLFLLGNPAKRTFARRELWPLLSCLLVLGIWLVASGLAQPRHPTWLAQALGVAALAGSVAAAASYGSLRAFAIGTRGAIFAIPVLAFAGIGQGLSEDPFSGTYGNPNDLAVYVLFLAPFMAHRTTGKKSIGIPIDVACIVTAVWVSYLTGSRTPYLILPLLIVGALAGLTSKRSTPVRALTLALRGAAALLVIVVVAELVGFSLLDWQVGRVADSSTADASRVGLAEVGVELTLDTAGLGGGPGYFLDNANGPTTSEGETIASPHNLFFELSTRYGVVPALLLFVFLVSSTARLSRRVPAQISGMLLGLMLLTISSVPSSVLAAPSFNAALFGFILLLTEDRSEERSDV